MTNKKDKTTNEKQVPKLLDWREYQGANSYLVELSVNYTRTRKVRAKSPEQAKEFAEAREMQYAKNSLKFRKTSLPYSIDSVVSNHVNKTPLTDIQKKMKEKEIGEG